MSNKQLTAKVRLDSTQAEQKLKNISRAIDKINRAVGKNSNLYGSVSSELAKVDQQAKKVANTTNRISSFFAKLHSKGASIRTIVGEWANNQRRVNTFARSTNSMYGSIWGKLKGIASTYLGIMGMRAMVQTSDTITSAENKLNYLNGGDATLTQETMDKMYTSAQKVRMGYTDMMANVSKSMTLAGDAFQGNIDNAIRFQEIMAEAYAVGGASAAEMHSSMYQMIQALGSGILQGDELRSVREGAPLAYKAIEEFAQGVYNTEESLKDLASQGKITADMVVAAINTAGNEMDAAFAQTAQTFAQTWAQIKNVATKAFEPVSHMLRDELNNAIDDGLIGNLEEVFTTISKVLQIIVKAVINTINWIAENWSWLKNLIVAGLLVLAGMWIWQAGVAIVSFVAMLVAMSPIQWTLLIILSSVMALIYVFYLWKTAAIDTCQAIVYALMIVGAAILLIGLIFHITAFIAIGAVIIVLGVLFMFFEQVCGIGWGILTFIGNLIQTILNIVVSMIAIIVALAINFVTLICNGVLGILNVIGAVCTNIEIAFSNAWNGAKAAFWDFIADCLSGLKKLETPINAIAKALGAEGFSLSGLTETVRGKADSARNNMQEYVSVGNAWSEGFNTHEYLNIGEVGSKAMQTFGTGIEDWSWQEAYNDGSSWASGIKDSINAWGAKFQNKAIGNQSLLDALGSKLGLDFGQIFPDNSPLDTNGGIGGLGGSYDPSKLLKGIGDDTGKIADGMDLTTEDLEYLRRIADMEWKKEYTTAEIKIDMTNNNQINGESDLDGIVTKLTDKLYEELNVVANGVYAY